MSKEKIKAVTVRFTPAVKMEPLDNVWDSEALNDLITAIRQMGVKDGSKWRGDIKLHVRNEKHHEVIKNIELD